MVAASFAQAIQPAKPGTAQATQQARQPAAEAKAGQPATTQGTQPIQVAQQTGQLAQTLIPQASQPTQAATAPPGRQSFAINVPSAASAQLQWEGHDGLVTSLDTEMDGHVVFAISPRPPNVCSWGGGFFVFDATTPIGKNVYAHLLWAKATAKTIRVNYLDSSAPGTDENSGCNLNTISVISDVITDPIY
jgi:hypothetical protein